MAKSSDNNTKPSSRALDRKEQARELAKKMVEGLNKQVLQESNKDEKPSKKKFPKQNTKPSLQKWADKMNKDMTKALNKHVLQESNEDEKPSSKKFPKQNTNPSLQKLADKTAKALVEGLNKAVLRKNNEPSSKGFDRMKAIMNAVDQTKDPGNDKPRNLKTILETEKNQILNPDSQDPSK